MKMKGFQIEVSCTDVNVSVDFSREEIKPFFTEKVDTNNRDELFFWKFRKMMFLVRNF